MTETALDSSRNLGPALPFDAERLSRRTPSRLDLRRGELLDPTGQPFVFDTVRRAVRDEALKFAPHYGEALGHPPFRNAVSALLKDAAGDEVPPETVQTLGGTHSLRLAGSVLKEVYGVTSIASSNPGWVKHEGIFAGAGLTTLTYPYTVSLGGNVDLPGILSAIETLPPKSAFLIQGVCHNPTGMDLGSTDLREIAGAIAKRGIVPVIDMAYTGYRDGVEADLGVLAAFRANPTLLVVTSFAKSLTLFGERLGALTIFEREGISTAGHARTMKDRIEADCLVPGSLFARAATTILEPGPIREKWIRELDATREQLAHRRTMLADALETYCAYDLAKETRAQRGMFVQLSLGPGAVEALRDTWGIDITRGGRIALGALPDDAIDFLARALAGVNRRHAVNPDSPETSLAYAALASSPSHWITGVDPVSYAARQATSCLYLETLFERILLASPPELVKPLASLFGNLTDLHRRQFSDLAAVRPVAVEPDRHSYYFSRMYEAEGLDPAMTAPLDHDALRRLLTIHAVSYLRGAERYELLAAHRTAENEPFIPVWERFRHDAPNNARLTFDWVARHLPDLDSLTLFTRVIDAETRVMESVWARASEQRIETAEPARDSL